MSKKIRVALLFGGRSAEHEVSLLSATSIYKNLDKDKFKVTSIYINKNGAWKIVESPLLSSDSMAKGRSFSFLPWNKRALLQDLDTDIYFPILHGPYGEDGTIQGLLEMADVPYVGASVMASAIAMDKAITKSILKAKNLPVVKHFIILKHEWAKQKEAMLLIINKEFPFPLFIKPACLGSSIGISKVTKKAEIPLALKEAFRYDRKILVEEGINGRELECSVLGNNTPRASLPGEIIPFREFYDYKDKYIEGKTRFGIPAELSSSQIKKIQRLSIETFEAICCSGMARVDFFLQEKTEKIFVNEINTIPGFTEISMYPKLWEASGLFFPPLLEKLIELGFERKEKKKRGKGNLPS
jgi:D-alanine-D-alanine ligase